MVLSIWGWVNDWVNEKAPCSCSLQEQGAFYDALLNSGSSDCVYLLAMGLPANAEVLPNVDVIYIADVVGVR